MLAASEIGAALLAASDEGYDCLVGSTPKRPMLFKSYADHPRQLIVLNSGLKSTAAGRYQFLSVTWDGLRKARGYADFSPINQDRGCIELLRQCGALPHILAASLTNVGELQLSFAKAAPIWASLPGSPYGQHTNQASDLMTTFATALGKYESPAQALGL